MKKFYILFSFLILINTSYSQWVWQNPLPQGSTLRSIQFVNAATGFEAGLGGRHGSWSF